MAARDQLLDHCHHRPDIAGGARFGAVGRDALDRRTQRPQRVHVGVIPADGFGGPLGDQRFEAAGVSCLLPGKGARVDLVIDVGEVADVGDVLRLVDMTQQTEQDVEHDDRPRVAQMCPVVNGRSADIHPDVLRIERQEILFAAGLCVVQADRGHGINLCGRNGRAGFSNFGVSDRNRKQARAE